MKKEVVFNEQTYYVAKPTAPDEAKAKLQQSRVFNTCISNGCCLRTQLNKTLKNSGIWDEEDDNYVDGLSKDIQDKLAKIDAGGIDIMEARQLAIEVNRQRMELINKLSVLREHDSLTAEGQADDAYFDSLVSSCCFNEDGTKVFKSYEDYINRSREDLSIKLAQELSGLVFGNTNFAKELPENKFLVEFGFVDEDMNYINEDGVKVDSSYKPIEPDEKKPERKPFLKNGEPIVK
jgi:hypothetical protein